ncbi:MAG: class I SAM-dependent methyltransferase [Candidatus Eisenbacteria bacterium]
MSENIRCPVSASHGTPGLDFVKDGLRVYRCGTCGTYVADAEYEETHYVDAAAEQIALTVDELLGRWGYRWGVILDAVSAVCPPPATLLDVGAGTGGFVYLACRRGYDATGVTMAGRDADYACETLGVQVSEGRFEELGSGEYDVVAANSVVEHVGDPGRLVACMARLVRPGGCVALTTPNPRAYRRLLLGSCRWKMFRAEHLCILSRRGLEELVRGVGLEPESYVTASMYLKGVERCFGPLAPHARATIACVIRSLGVGGDQILVAKRPM